MLQSRTASGRVVPQTHDNLDSDSGIELSNDFMTDLASTSLGRGVGSGSGNEMKYRVPSSSRTYDHSEKPSLSDFSKSRLGSMPDTSPTSASQQDAQFTTNTNGLRPPSIKRKNASIPNLLHRASSFHSFSAMLLMSKENNINVLRTSIYELHERVKYRWVLHPFSTLKTIWDLLNAIVVIYYSWMIPFMLCFEWYTPSEGTSIFLKLLDIWGLLDIILRFRTGIIEYGTVVMNPRRIRQEYLRSPWFPIDLVSTIPFEYFVGNTANVSTRKSIKIIKYIKLPRLLRIGRFVKYIKRYKRYSGMTISIHALLFIAHVSGCIWVAVLSPCSGSDGDTEPKCQPGEEMSLYWISFHHGLVTLLGISVNHIEASNVILDGGYHKSSLEDGVFLWSCVVSIIGAVMTAILFGTVVDIVQSWNRVENTFRKKMDQISHEMDALCLPKHIRNRVNAYYDYLWLNSRTFSEELNLLKDNGMSMALRQQIAIYLFKDYLQKIPFFQLATDSILGMICMQLRQVIYMPDDFIIKEGDIGKELFMIVKGIVRVMPPKDQNQNQNQNQNQFDQEHEEKKILLGEGDFFGEIGVVMEVERTRSVKAECMAELCILSREGFDKILAEFPEFATAMKKLIIKRVSELWKQDGKGRIEKMTALADKQMKNKINAYHNVNKLRNTTNVLRRLNHPQRLSRMIHNASIMEDEHEHEDEQIENVGIVQPGQQVQGSVAFIGKEEEEQEEEEESQQQQQEEEEQIMMDDSLLVQQQVLQVPKKKMEAAEINTHDSNHIKAKNEEAAPRHRHHHQYHHHHHKDHDHHDDHEELENDHDHDSNETNTSKKIRKLHKHMRLMERKVDDRFHAMEDKLNLILQALTSTNSMTDIDPNVQESSPKAQEDMTATQSNGHEQEEQEDKQKVSFFPSNIVEDEV